MCDFLRLSSNEISGWIYKTGQKCTVTRLIVGSGDHAEDKFGPRTTNQQQQRQRSSIAPPLRIVGSDTEHFAFYFEKLTHVRTKKKICEINLHV